jgi:hypothetical protein
MCTVTFLPNPKKGYLLTSSRDEKTSRLAALFPKKYVIGKQQVFFPKDKLAGGTWIVTSINNFTLCLLNGAFEKHESKPSYKMSRGLMVLDFFKFNNVSQFISEFNFNDIENFTLIIVDANTVLNLYEIRWDGIKLHVTSMDSSQPHIWSSATLYSNQAVKNRKNWFTNYLNTAAIFSKENIMKFHLTAGDGSLENSILMNRDDKVKTVSITCVDHSEINYTMYYLNTQNMETSTLRIFKTEPI